MKKIIVIFMLMLGLVGFSQKNTPRYHIVENDTIGIIISISHAQRIDNDRDILKLYENLSGGYVKSGAQYIIIIDKMQQQIGVLKLMIDGHGKVINDKDIVINDLKNIIKNNEERDILFNEELVNKNIEIKNLKKQVRQSFWQKLGGSTIALLVIGFLIVR